MWELPTHEHTTFARNPLETVVFQLRFHPILKVPGRVADFQDAVRARFPGFQEVESQRVDFQLPAVQAVQVRREAAFVFRSEDGKTVVSLAQDSLSITEQDHISRVTLLKDVRIALDALNSLYSPVACTRLGLRYVNLVDKERIGADLGRSVAWSDLVQESFLRFPLATVDGETLFYSEATSPRDPGSMTLRYGILPEANRAPRFRLDVDRFLDNPGQLGDPAIAKLQQFSTDIYAVFRSAAHTELVNWMKDEEK